MTYDWEKKIGPSILWQIDAILPDGITLMGVSVKNETRVEGALICAVPPLSDIEYLDVSQDIMGDANRHYAEGLRLLHEGAHD